MMPGQIPDPSVTAGSLPGLGPLTGLPSSALTAEELKYADIRNIGAMIAPLHFLEVKLGKRPQPVKSEVSKPRHPRCSSRAGDWALHPGSGPYRTVQQNLGLAVWSARAGGICATPGLSPLASLQTC